MKILNFQSDRAKRHSVFWLLFFSLFHFGARHFIHQWVLSEHLFNAHTFCCDRICLFRFFRNSLLLLKMRYIFRFAAMIITIPSLLLPSSSSSSSLLSSSSSSLLLLCSAQVKQGERKNYNFHFVIYTFLVLVFSFHWLCVCVCRLYCECRTKSVRSARRLQFGALYFTLRLKQQPTHNKQQSNIGIDKHKHWSNLFHLLSAIRTKTKPIQPRKSETTQPKNALYLASRQPMECAPHAAYIYGFSIDLKQRQYW